jgi:periplasmic divalent cation tolerance protein
MDNILLASPPGEFLKLLEAHREQFRDALPQRLALLEAMSGQLAAAAAPDPEKMEDFERRAHSLAGSAGTFGFHEIGQAARSLEAAVRRLRAAGCGVAGRQVGTALAGLRRSMSTCVRELN